jgi:tRNA/rRNA methyltransferase
MELDLPKVAKPSLETSELGKDSLSILARPYRLHVVLVRPIYPRNIGAVSRAMSNMGGDDLILIAPQCEIDYEAQEAAATGQTALRNRTTYGSWEEFYAKNPDGIRLSLTARDGRGRSVRDLTELLPELPNLSPSLQVKTETPLSLYLFFGPEDWGLSAEDLELSHFCCSIPTYGENWSLNLGQAVMLSLFIVRQAWGGQRTTLDGQQLPRKSSRAEVFPENTLREWLLEMKFDLSKKKINAFTVLRRMLLQNVPTAKELRILEIVLQQSIRKLREYNQRSK